MLLIQGGEGGGGQPGVISGHGGPEAVPAQMPAGAALIGQIAPAAEAGQPPAHAEKAHGARPGDEHAAVLPAQAGGQGDEGVGADGQGAGIGQQAAQHVLQPRPVAALSSGGAQMDGVQGGGKAAAFLQHGGKAPAQALLQSVEAVCVGIVAGNGAFFQHAPGLVAQHHPAAGAAAVDADQIAVHSAVSPPTGPAPGPRRSRRAPAPPGPPPGSRGGAGG